MNVYVLQLIRIRPTQQQIQEEKNPERGDHNHLRISSQPSEDFFTHQHNLDRSVIFHYRSMYLVLCMPVNETKHLPQTTQESSFLSPASSKTQQINHVDLGTPVQ